jgi:hypothetical protein
MKRSFTGMSGSGMGFLFNNLEWILPIFLRSQRPRWERI